MVLVKYCFVGVLFSYASIAFCLCISKDRERHRSNRGETFLVFLFGLRVKSDH